SSTSITVIIARSSRCREPDRHAGATRTGFDTQLSVHDLDAVAHAAQPEVTPGYTHVQLARQHLVDVESFAVIADFHYDVTAIGADRDFHLEHTRVPRGIRERLLQNPVQRDLERERHRRKLAVHVKVHRGAGERLVLHDESFENGADGPALELGWPEGADEVADFAKGPFERGRYARENE